MAHHAEEPPGGGMPSPADLAAAFEELAAGPDEAAPDDADLEIGARGPTSWAARTFARSGDACPECQVALVLSGCSLVCPDCGADYLAADLSEHIVSARADPRPPGVPIPKGRLHVVGINNKQYQGNLDRISPASQAEQQKAALFRELCTWNQNYQSRGGQPFPRNVLSHSVEIYNQVQKIEVKRSNEKRVIVAAIVYHMCLHLGFHRRPCEAADFAGLERSGLARGEAYLRKQIEDGLIVFTLDNNPLVKLLTTAFANLEMCPKLDSAIWDVVVEVVERAKHLLIGDRCEDNSMVLGATANALLRDGGSSKEVLARVATTCSIRRSTLTGFLTHLYNFHSRFAPIYKANGLADGRRDGWVPAKRGKKKKKKK